MRLSTLFASTVLATVLASSAAFAGTITTFTWNPNGTTPVTLSGPGSQFSASDMTVADYATIDISDLTHVTESGWLAVTALNTPTTPGFVNGTGSGVGQGGGSPYQLYFQFSSVSHLNPLAPGVLVGAFDSLSYTLYGDVGGTCHFDVTGLSGCGANQLVLATGSLAAGGQNDVSIIAGLPAAHADVSILIGANAGSFFVNPATLAGFVFETGFTNTNGVVSNPNGPIITINGGGGNVDLLGVPEPLTLSVFGAGLAGAAALRRRKAKKA